MIPKIIHQIWFQGKDQCPHMANCQTWKDKNRGYEYIFWDEQMMTELVQSKYLYLYDRWSNYKYMHQKIDLFKYILMDYYGGIYADVDSVCLKPFDTLINQVKDGVVVSGLAGNKLEHFVTMGSSDAVNNGVIMSTRGHPFWSWYITKIMDQKGPWLTKFNEIQNTTGPAFFSKCIYEYKGEGITVLNHQFFEPCYSGDPYCKISKNSYVDHQHSQTWINPIMKWFVKMYYGVKYYFPSIIIIFVFLFFVFSGR